MVLFPGVMISATQLSSLFRRRASNAPTHHRHALPSSYAGATEVRPFRTTSDDSASDRGTLGDGFDLKKHLMEEERKYLLSALRMAEGVVAEAAHLVSLRRTTFVEKMRRHKIVRRMALTDHRSDLVRRE